MSDETIFILNPLASTLRHYESELIDTLAAAGYRAAETIPTVEGEGISGAAQRIRVAAASLSERVRMGSAMRNRTIIVAWPLFSYLDPLTLWGLCRRNRVFIVMHDPTPLRRSYGHSGVPRRIFKWIVEHTDTHVVYHTELAQRTGSAVCGVTGTVIPHPIGRASIGTCPPVDIEARRTIRVLGQYKPARTLAPLQQIAAREVGAYRLEIHGRGWPSLEGWAVSDRFVAEEEFDELIRTADCVVIPYDSFFQSGVAVRCLENGVPVVAPEHEHVAELYGEDWPGLVHDENDWCDAVSRVLETDRTAVVVRAHDVRAQVGRDWAEALRR